MFEKLVIVNMTSWSFTKEVPTIVVRMKSERWFDEKTPPFFTLKWEV